MKIPLLLLSATLVYSTPVQYFDYAQWHNAIGWVYATDTFAGPSSGLQWSGDGIQGVSGAGMGIWLRSSPATGVEFTTPGGFTGFGMFLDTFPAAPGTGVIMSLDGASLGSVGTGPGFDGFWGWTSDVPVDVVRLTTFPPFGSRLQEHGTIEGVVFKVANTPEPGTLPLLLFGVVGYLVGWRVMRVEILKRVDRWIGRR